MANYDYYKELGIDEDVEFDWLKAFIAEEKSLYNEIPNSERINESWKLNKEYYYALIRDSIK